MVRIRGRETPFLARQQIGRRDFFLLERVGSAWRERYRAFDPLAGPGGDFFVVQVSPQGPEVEQLLHVGRRLKGEGLPRAVAVDRRQDGVWIVWSWVDGISLADYFAHLRAGRRPPVGPAEAVRLVHGLAHAVSQLHQRAQVVHADIQPANVILTDHPSRLRLIDFGNAWTIQTTVQRVAGDGFHPCYAAPELQRGLIQVGFAADQFSVHVLLYELLTAHIPYAGLGGKSGLPEFLAGTQNSLAPPSRHSAACHELPRSLGNELDAVVCRGLALTAADRYPDRHAWLDALGQLLTRLRQPPRELPPIERTLTGALRWFIGRAVD